MVLGAGLALCAASAMAGNAQPQAGQESCEVRLSLLSSEYERKNDDVSVKYKVVLPSDDDSLSQRVRAWMIECVHDYGALVESDMPICPPFVPGADTPLEGIAKYYTDSRYGYMNEELPEGHREAYSLEVSPVEQGERWLTCKVVTIEKTAGPGYGNAWETMSDLYYTFDTRSGEIVLDFLNNDAEQGLQQAMGQQLMAQLGEEMGMQLSWAQFDGLLVHPDQPIELGPNQCPTSKGLLIGWAMNRVLANSKITHIVLPWDVVQPYLTAQARDMLGL